MKIEYKIGDLLTAPETLIVHGCNARGEMGAGLALSIRAHLPFAYDAYRRHHAERGLQVGDVVWAVNQRHGERPRIVGNLITQANYGRAPQQYVDYAGMTRCFQEVNAFVQKTQAGTVELSAIGQIREVGMPLIGAGLGGGSWSVISAIIETEATAFRPIVYTLDGKIPD